MRTCPPASGPGAGEGGVRISGVVSVYDASGPAPVVGAAEGEERGKGTQDGRSRACVIGFPPRRWTSSMPIPCPLSVIQEEVLGLLLEGARDVVRYA